MMKVAIITVSDQGARGQREDVSAETIRNILAEIKAQVIHYQIVPDGRNQIQSALIEAVDQWKVDLVLTTGGTGFAIRDVTPEATEAVLEKTVPGIETGRSDQRGARQRSTRSDRLGPTVLRSTRAASC